MGELFTWKHSFAFIEFIKKLGLNFVVFTNGTLLDKEKIKLLNDLEVALIVSIRDTIESFHNKMVHKNAFRKTLKTVENAIAIGMHLANRLGVEIPVNIKNEQRILKDLLPLLRHLGVIPLIEEYIQISVSKEEQLISHNFEASRNFFKRMCIKDTELGVNWSPELGTRMIAQPKCKRPLYSFAIFPSRDIVDCPSHSVTFGNLRDKSIEKIIYSTKYRQFILNHDLCACSVFYTDSNSEVPENLPYYLESLK